MTFLTFEHSPSQDRARLLEVLDCELCLSEVDTAPGESGSLSMSIHVYPRNMHDGVPKIAKLPSKWFKYGWG